LAPAPFNQQPLAYQQQPPQYPPAPQAPFMQQPLAPMAPMSPAMPPPMNAYQNDEPGNEAGLQAGFTGNQPDLEGGLSDAALAKALQNENQPLAFQNGNLPPSDERNFFQPPPAANEQQQEQLPPPPSPQPLADEPASAPPAANPMIAPQPGWDRSATLQ